MMRLLAVLSFALVCAAEERNIHSSVRYTIKPERVGDFEAAIKEYNAVLTKAGWEKSSSLWQAATGPNEFVLVRYLAKFAEMDVTRDPKLKDVSSDLQRIGARIRQCIESSTHRIAYVDTELSLPRSATPPKMVRVRSTTLKPGKREAYRALVKETIIPAAKTAGVKSYVTFRTAFGGSLDEMFSSYGLDNWADLDQTPSPLVKAIGEEKYRQYQAKQSELVERTEVNVYRFREELSYSAGNGKPKSD